MYMKKNWNLQIDDVIWVEFWDEIPLSTISLTASRTAKRSGPIRGTRRRLNGKRLHRRRMGILPHHQSPIEDLTNTASQGRKKTS